jgi:hypothetical protein
MQLSNSAGRTGRCSRAGKQFCDQAADRKLKGEETMKKITWADVFTLSPSDDMYTDPEHPGVTPTITELWTANYSTSGHYERIMMKFDLSAYSGYSTDSAILHLTRFFSCPSSGTTASTFYAISEEWDEDSWDYTQHIQYETSVNMAYIFSGSGGSAITQFEVDITDFMNEFLQGNVDNYGFVIMANDNQKFSKFYSKEYSNEDYRPTLELSIPALDAENNTVISIAELHQNYPNPFNPTTTISFNISAQNAEEAKIEIYNSKGQKVKTLDCCNSFAAASKELTHSKSVVWNGTDESGTKVSSGIYLYKLIVDDRFVSSRKMVLMK